MGTIGRVHTGKGQDVLVDIAPQLCANVPELRLVIIGSGPLRDMLADRVRALGLADRVLFIGRVPPDDMPETISALDILVHVSDREGLARVIMQALACGKPVVSYNLDGSPEIVADRVNGRLVTPGDREDLIEAIIELARDERLRTAWGNNGPTTVDPEFRVETMVRQTDEHYRFLLTRAGLPLLPRRTVPLYEQWQSAP